MSHTYRRRILPILIKNAAKSVLSRPETFLVIRPHPRQSESQLRELLSDFDKNRWAIDNTDLFLYF